MELLKSIEGAQALRGKGPFRTVLADPPWPFKDAGSRLAPEYRGKGRERPIYQTQTIEDILGMAPLLRTVTPEDAFLLLWCPDALILDGTGAKVAHAWGFEPRQMWPWIKVDSKGTPRLGGGHYARLVSEPCIAAAKGAAVEIMDERLMLCRAGKAKVKRRDVPGLVVEHGPGLIAQRGTHAGGKGHHSAKPDIQYSLIEELFEGPYLELYARQRYSEAWMVWGNQAPETD
jgi:N6-adenosine-specific RNA methylase IME4